MRGSSRNSIESYNIGRYQIWYRPIWIGLIIVTLSVGMLSLTGCSAKGKAEKRYKEGMIFFQHNQYQKAVAKLEEAIEIDPTRSDIYASAAELYLRIKRYAKAVEAGEKALELDPKAPSSVFLTLGMAYLNKSYFGDESASDMSDDSTVYRKGTLDPTLYHKTEELALKLERERPGTAEVDILWGILFRFEAIDMRNKGDAKFTEKITSSTDRLKEAIKKDPENLVALSNIVDTYAVNSDFDQSVTYAQKWYDLAKQPNDKTKAADALAGILLAIGRYDDAYTILEPIIKDPEKTSFTEYKLAGKILLAKLDYLCNLMEPTVMSPTPLPSKDMNPDIAAVIKQMAELSATMKGLFPNEGFPFFLRSVSYMFDGNNDEVLANLKAAIEKERSPLTSLFNYALVAHYLRQGQSTEAKEAIRDWSLKLQGDPLASLATARVFEIDGDYEAAANILDSFLRNYPQDLGIAIRLAEDYARAGQGNRAAELLHRLQTETTQNPAVNERIANALISIGNPKYVDEGMAILNELSNAGIVPQGGPHMLEGLRALQELSKIQNPDAEKDKILQLYMKAQKEFELSFESNPGNQMILRRLLELVLQRNDLLTALRYIHSARDFSPDMILLEADLFTKFGQLDIARGLYLQLLAKYPNRISAETAIIKIDTQLGRFAEARARCNEIITKYPDNPMGYLLKAASSRTPEELSEAIEQIKQNLTTRFADNQPIRIALAHLLIRAGHPEEAASYLRDIEIKLERELENVRDKERSVITDTLVARYMDHALAELLDDKSYAAAQATAQKALKLIEPMASKNPDQVKTLIAISLLAQKQPGEAALVLRDSSVKVNPVRAFAFAAQGRTDEAIEAVNTMEVKDVGLTKLFEKMLKTQSAAQLNDSASLLALYAFMSSNPDFWNVSMQLLDKALIIMPDCDFILANKAELSMLQGKETDAIKIYDILIPKHPDIPELSLKKGNALTQAGTKTSGAEQRTLFDQAIKTYDDLLAIHPDATTAMLAKAALLKTTGRTDDAVALYRQLNTLIPNDWVILNSLAWNLFEAGKLDEAANYAQQALKIAEQKKIPEISFILDTLGWIEFNRGNTEQAERLLEQAVMTMPNHPDIRYHLAQTFIKKARPDEAKPHLEAIILGAPNFESIDEVKALLKQIGGSSE